VADRRDDRYAAVERADSVAHVLVPRAGARNGSIEAGPVVLDLEAQCVCVGVERDGDLRGGPTVLGRVLDRLDAAVVDRRFHFGGMAADAVRLEVERRDRLALEVVKGGDQSSLAEHRRVEPVGDRA
jgi:hypothetical protein